MTGTMVPGINIQWPWSTLLLEGSKVVETRRYQIPEHYIGVPLALIETPGPAGKNSAKIIATIEFSGCFKYRSKSEWTADFERHRVPSDSPFAFSGERDTWGWVIKAVKPLRTPAPPPERRGIVFTKECSI